MAKSAEQLRELMIETQIVARGVTDSRVLRAMGMVPRHLFAADYSLETAYGDHPLGIDHGQFISQPYIVALMSALCSLRGHERVLEVGTGSGYQTAILSLLAREVYSLELVKELAETADERLRRLGFSSIRIKVADGYGGWPQSAPFDVIMLTACPKVLPPKLTGQLVENGLIIAPVGGSRQSLRIFHKLNGVMVGKSLIPVRFVPMVRGE